MDWGMRNRLSRILQPQDGRTVMLAVDHGYFLGPTHRLENPRATANANDMPMGSPLAANAMPPPTTPVKSRCEVAVPQTS